MQQPVVPRGRKSGPRPKLARISNLKDQTSVHQQPPPSNEAEVLEGQDTTKEFSKMVQVSASPSGGGCQAEGNSNINSSQDNQISGEVIQLCSSSNVELNNLNSVSTSQLPQQFNIYSTKNQFVSYNNMITDASNIYVSLSQDVPQLIQLSAQDTNNFVIQPGDHDVSHFVQNDDTERQYGGKLDSSLKEKLSHSVHILKPTAKANDLTLYTKNVLHENSIQDNGNVVIDKADKAKLYHNEEDNIDMEADNPKTYVNLRTFLESSEVVETLTSSRNDEVGDGDNGLVNLEYVTLMADDGKGGSFSSRVQEIIVLPGDTIISDYDLSKNAGRLRMVVQGNEGNSDRKPACCTEQIVKEHTEPLTVLTEAFVPSQTINDDSHLSHTADKRMVTQTSSTNCSNLIEVLLPSTNGNKLSSNTGDVNDKVQNDTLDSSNLVQVLLETEGSNTRTQQEYTIRTQQTLLASSDGFGDEDAIIRMLSSQGTVMLSRTLTDFDLTKSPVAEVTQLTESGSEAVGRAMNEDCTQPLLNFKSFSTVDATVMHETTVSKEESNRCIDVTSSDYSHEISLTTAFTSNNSDVNSVRKALSEELKDGMTSGGLQTSDQNEISKGTMDDIEIFELCTEEDFPKFAPIYQVYHTGKSIENV